MNKVPLYSLPTDPDAWRAVRSPGGYEWWYFDAEDRTDDLQIVVIFFQGFVFHPGYLRRYARYLKRPTKMLPPVPADYPCVYAAVYEKGKVLAQFMRQYPSEEFAASSSTVDVRVGENVVKREEGRYRFEVDSPPWVLTGRGPKLVIDKSLKLSMTFKPELSHPPAERTFLSRAMTGADHHWIIAAPRCEVEGTINFDGRRIEFHGRGYHDHNFGTAPLGSGLKRWIWGRVLLQESAWTFHYASPRDPVLKDEPHLLLASEVGVEDIAVRDVTTNWNRTTAMGIRYPSRVQFDQRMWLTQPRVIDSTPFYLRLMYEARCDKQIGEAFCEVAQPNRLRWPVLGRMIEMSIDRGKR